MEPLSKTTIFRVINNRGTAEEAKRVAAWLATSEGQEWLAGAIIQDADLIDRNILPLLEDIPTEEMIRIILRNISRRRHRRIIFTCAAALIPCLVLVGMWLNINKKIGGVLLADENIETVVVEKGKKKEIVFQDGSSITLNSCSSLRYPHRFGLSERRVQLDGEAFFNIESNNLRPFIVEINKNAEIQVLGTQFNVSAYEDSDDIDITLINGCIQFSDELQTITLNPNECLNYDKNTKEISVRQIGDANQNLLWMENILLFRDAPLMDVLSTLDRNYNVTFHISNEAIKSYSYSLKAKSDEPIERILEDMENISNISFEKQGKHYIVKHRDI